MAAPPASLTEPFLLPGDDTGILLVHGFTGSTWDMRFLAERLHGWNATTHVPCLAGHGTTLEDMEGHTWEDWLRSAEEGLIELDRRTPKPTVVGQSMGALLALALAARHPERVGRLVLLAPAVVTAMSWLPTVAPLIPLVLTATGSTFRFLPKQESDIACAEARRDSPGYRGTPLRSVLELVRLQEYVRPLLPKIEHEVLVIHSRQDHTCPLDNVRILQSELAGPVRSVILNDSYHVVSVDVDKEQVAREIAAFAGVDGRLAAQFGG